MHFSLAGRGGNEWLSPLGCAMFTIALNIPLSSQVGRRLPFLQHIAAVAVVKSINAIPALKVLALVLHLAFRVYAFQINTHAIRENEQTAVSRPLQYTNN